MKFGTSFAAGYMEWINESVFTPDNASRFPCAAEAVLPQSNVVRHGAAMHRRRANYNPAVRHPCIHPEDFILSGG